MFRCPTHASVAVVSAVVALGLSACGATSTASQGNSSSSGGASTQAGGGSTQTANAASPAVTISTCTLLTSAQVAALLGETPTSNGNEHVFDGNYKKCTWFGANTSNMVSVAVNICNCTENQGFDNSGFGSPASYPGVGDSAKFSIATSGSGADFSAVKGRVAVSLVYMSPVDPSTVKSSMAAAVQQILPQFS